MSQTELATSADNSPLAANDAAFSDDTRNSALKKLERDYGGVFSAMRGPISSIIGWIVNQSNYPPSEASGVVEARRIFNAAATHLTEINHLGKTASNEESFKKRA